MQPSVPHDINGAPLQYAGRADSAVKNERGQDVGYYFFEHAGSDDGKAEASLLRGRFDVSISGIGASTVNLLVSNDGGATWRTWKSYTADVETIAETTADNQLFASQCVGADTPTVRMYQ